MVQTNHSLTLDIIYSIIPEHQQMLQLSEKLIFKAEIYYEH